MHCFNERSKNKERNRKRIENELKRSNLRFFERKIKSWKRKKKSTRIRFSKINRSNHRKIKNESNLWRNDKKSWKKCLTILLENVLKNKSKRKPLSSSKNLKREFEKMSFTFTLKNKNSKKLKTRRRSNSILILCNQIQSKIYSLTIQIHFHNCILNLQRNKSILKGNLL